VAFLAKRLERRHGSQDTPLWQQNHGVRAFAQLRIELECTTVELNQVLHDGQPEPGSALRRLVG
jgi:hypothetical protein